MATCYGYDEYGYLVAEPFCGAIVVDVQYDCEARGGSYYSDPSSEYKYNLLCCFNSCVPYSVTTQIDAVAECGFDGGPSLENFIGSCESRLRSAYPSVNANIMTYWGCNGGSVGYITCQFDCSGSGGSGCFDYCSD